MRKGLEFLSGSDDISASIRSIKSQVSAPVQRARMLFQRAPIQALPTDSTDPAERFRVAAEMYGVSDAEIERKTRTSAVCFWLSAVPIFPLIAVAGMLARWRDFDAAIITASLLLICTSQALKCGLANYQFRTHSLHSFGDYWRTDLMPRFRSERP